MRGPVLVVAAHPDDEILGCGATMARLAADGVAIHIAILAEGITSRFTDRGEAPEEQLADLHRDARQAAKIVGAAGVSLHGLPDNRLDSVDLLDVVKVVEELVAEHRPETILTHHPGDMNIDHGVVHRAVMTATRPVGDHVVGAVYAFEVPSSTEWSFGAVGPPFVPDTFVAVAETLEAKVEAMEAYESEARPFPHPRSPDALRALARARGAAAGVSAAEAFALQRRIL